LIERKSIVDGLLLALR